MKYFEKYKEQFCIYCVNIFLLLAYWGQFLRDHYTSDSLSHRFVDDADIQTNIDAGRYMISLGDWILFQFGHRNTDSTALTMLVTFVLLAGAMSLLVCVARKFCKLTKGNFLLVYFAITLTFLNVLFAETFVFTECAPYFALAYFLASAAVLLYANKRYVPAFLCLCVATCCYQNATIFAVILIAFLVMYESQFQLKWPVVLREVITLIVAFMPLLLNYFSIKVLQLLGINRHFNKGVGMGDLGKKLQKILDSIVALYRDGNGILPSVYLPLLFTLVVLVVLGLYAFRNRKWMELCYILLVWAGSHLVLISFPLLQGKIYFSPRLSFGFFLIQGMLMLSVLILCKDEISILLKGMAALYGLVMLLCCQVIASDQLMSNRLDEIYVKLVYQKILEYEEETGNRVSYYSIINDTYAEPYYPELTFHAYQIGERSIGIVNKHVFQYYTGRVFERTDMAEDIYEEHFKDRDWEAFNMDEQLYIEGDTFYWCLF